MTLHKTFDKKQQPKFLPFKVILIFILDLSFSCSLNVCMCVSLTNKFHIERLNLHLPDFLFFLYALLRNILTAKPTVTHSIVNDWISSSFFSLSLSMSIFSHIHLILRWMSIDLGKALSTS